MSVTKLPNGKWRAQTWDSRVGKNVAVAKILGPDFKSFATKRDAKAARSKAQEKLRAMQGTSTTVRGFASRWLSDPLFTPEKESSQGNYASGVRVFVEKYGNLPMEQIGDRVVAEFLAAGAKQYQIAPLRAMWNDAMGVKAGRVVSHNPFAKLGLEQSTGNRKKKPPSEELIREIIATARQHGGPGFQNWLKIAAGTGCRPAEVDLLRPEHVLLDQGRILIVDQFHARLKKKTSPKNGDPRVAVITPMAREAFEEIPRGAKFCATNLRGNHWTHSARYNHWKKIREAVGFKGSLYLATRHYAGWYMTNVLELPSEDVAIALGHEDGGELVRSLYGHREAERALGRVARAYAGMAQVVPIGSARRTA